MTKSIKHSLTASFIISSFIFTGCSFKSDRTYSYGNYGNINSIYKHTSNTKIRNSKAMHRATLRPYNVFGIDYYPRIETLGSTFNGIASWYGPNFHAKKTSNGETYNMYAMTAAHKTLPMNTMVRVYNLENGKSTVVRVNDRGPFVDGRIIDLSNSAAHKIDMVKKGTAQVRITVLGYNGEINNANLPVTQVATNTRKQLGKKIASNVSNNYGIQIGAFSKLAGAQQTKNNYEDLFGKSVEIEKVLVNGRYLHKVYIIGFDSYNSASSFRNTQELNRAIVVER